MSGLEIIVGTYEEYTVGYKVEPLKTDPSSLYLKEIFSTHSHTSSIRVLASHDKFLASGGADDRICIFDLESGTLKDELLHHNGTVNCLTFVPDGSYLFSCSFDGSVSAINMKKLAIDKTWKNAHKAPVLCISVHPSGNLMLTLGADMSLRTWDLVKGRMIYTRGLRNDPKYKGGLSWVEWGPDGSFFALMGAHSIDVISLETTKSVRTVQCPCRPVTFCWISETEIAVGLDDGHLLMFNVNEEGEPEKIKAYETRLKAMQFAAGHLATASSGGDISLWKIENNELREVCTTNLGCRPTCLVLVEADRLGLHKYLATQEDSKEELKQQLKRIRSIGKVIVEREDELQESDEEGGKSSKKSKRQSRQNGKEQITSPVLKKKKKIKEQLSGLPVVASLTESNKERHNQSTSGIWEEEDIQEIKESVEETPSREKLKKKKSNMQVQIL
ncbi:p21-activated protein kinase-interacting protein 1-like [Toxorhynchites rutilus septentrionalis]|uniref:p21-activated protein kinase-interacting protein 1-like n=1 Tax=Toxorhynchites rutilus septentrionalis TaxID=329112 RepID=UPI00247A5770|nr:p21-activated protein kinase-interacting protein 1-like [Toxorhynchites rutilus septentrionalis]